MTLSDYLSRRGAINELAAAIGVAHTTVMRWRDGRVPADRVRAVASITGIPAEAIRPDIAEIFVTGATKDSVLPHAHG